MSLYLSKEKFDEIKSRYENLLIMDSDIADTFAFVHEVPIAEADALKERESSATSSIAKLEDAAYNVFDVGRDIEDENFFE